VETGSPRQKPRFSPLAVACVLLIVLGAKVLSRWLLVDTEVAVGESVFAGMVATAIVIMMGRFPI
jgi:hypothetical protein